MAMAYDDVSKKVILFGGYDATSYLNETLAWDGATWTQIAAGECSLPASRLRHWLRPCLGKRGSVRRV